ncbi:uncharacterized protein BDV17DRAFT_277129 [Aspergillus undulatus]|uniref:uncharacterized protein n=1 Tax=Aspergillus undulatus TaxID=1810928 RepID=UPI003CCE2FEF
MRRPAQLMRDELIVRINRPPRTRRSLRSAGNRVHDDGSRLSPTSCATPTSIQLRAHVPWW